MSDEERNKQLLTEYQMLREEILRADALIYQVLGFLLAASGVLLTSAFRIETLLPKQMALLSLYAVTLPASQFLWTARTRILRIGAYMRIFLEKDLKHINWEKRLWKARKLDRKNNESNKKKDSDKTKRTGGPFRNTNFSSNTTQNIWTTILCLNLSSLAASFLFVLFEEEKCDVLSFSCLTLPKCLILPMLNLIFFVAVGCFTYWQRSRLIRAGCAEVYSNKTWKKVCKQEKTQKSDKLEA